MTEPEQQPQNTITQTQLHELQKLIERSNPLTWELQIKERERSTYTTEKDPEPREGYFDFTTIVIPDGLDRTIFLRAHRESKVVSENSAPANILDLLDGMDTGGFFGSQRKLPFPGGSGVAQGYTVSLEDEASEGGQITIRGRGAEKLVLAAWDQLKPLEKVAQKFLTKLITDPKTADKLQWTKTMSEDEKETIFTAIKDEFEIRISALKKSELLDIRLIVYEARIALKEQLVGPIIVGGEKVEELFQHLEARNEPSDSSKIE